MRKRLNELFFEALAWIVIFTFPISAPLELFIEWIFNIKTPKTSITTMEVNHNGLN